MASSINIKSEMEKKFLTFNILKNKFRTNLESEIRFGKITSNENMRKGESGTGIIFET